MQIEVCQPRGIVIGKHVLLPGRNDVSQELAELIASRPGTMRALEKLERAKVIKTGSGGEQLAGDSLVGLDEATAIRMVEATHTRAQLDVWKRRAKGKLRVAIEDQIAIIEMEKGSA